jgi:hypothetical protein
MNVCARAVCLRGSAPIGGNLIPSGHAHPTPQSGFHGVHANKKRWRAQITYGGKQHNLGYFGTKQEAALACDRAARGHTWWVQERTELHEHRGSRGGSIRSTSPQGGPRSFAAYMAANPLNVQPLWFYQRLSGNPSDSSHCFLKNNVCSLVIPLLEGSSRSTHMQ